MTLSPHRTSGSSGQRDPSAPADPVAGSALFPFAAALLGLAFAAAIAGLLIDDVYTGAESTAAMFRGYDLVTLTVVAPALAVAALNLHRRSRTPALAVTGLAAYLVYTYAYYLFGTGFNDLFLVHIAVFGTALVTVVLGFRTVSAIEAPALLLARPRARLTAALLGLLTLALGGMWVWAGVDNALTGAVPAGSRLVETDTVVRLGIALDLGVLVPFYLVAAVLLWRGAVWGFLLGSVALLSGLLHQVSYLVAMPMQVAADVPEAVSSDPAEPVVVLVYLFGAILLARSRKGTPTNASRRADSAD